MSVTGLPMGDMDIASGTATGGVDTGLGATATGAAGYVGTAMLTTSGDIAGRGDGASSIII